MRASDFIKPGETIDDVIIRYLRDHDATPAYLYLEGKVLTEENTDLALDWAERKLSGFRVKVWKLSLPVPVGVARRVLDSMLPEKLLEMIAEVMIRRGMLSDRRIRSDNPFTRL